MNKQVLSIEQMQELIDLGIDTSKASTYWYGTDEVEFVCSGTDMDKDCGDEICPTFTLQDILEMLPDTGKGYANYPHLFKASDGINWYCSYGTVTCEIMGETPLNAAFKMLKRCKENKYI